MSALCQDVALHAERMNELDYLQYPAFGRVGGYLLRSCPYTELERSPSDVGALSELQAQLTEQIVTGPSMRFLRYGVMEFHVLRDTMTVEKCYQSLKCSSIALWVGFLGTTADSAFDRFLVLFRKLDNRTLCDFQLDETGPINTWVFRRIPPNQAVQHISRVLTDLYPKCVEFFAGDFLVQPPGDQVSIEMVFDIVQSLDDRQWNVLVGNSKQVKKDLRDPFVTIVLNCQKELERLRALKSQQKDDTIGLVPVIDPVEKIFPADAFIDFRQIIGTRFDDI